MTRQGTWVAASSTMAEKYGGSFLRAQSASPEASANMTELPAVAQAPTGSGKPLSASSGLFGIGVVAAVSFGLMAFATTVRVGHAEAHVGVGKT